MKEDTRKHSTNLNQDTPSPIDQWLENSTVTTGRRSAVDFSLECHDRNIVINTVPFKRPMQAISKKMKDISNKGLAE